MLIRIGMENNMEGRSLAWALDFPGAFAYGTDATEALLALPRSLVQYENWANNHAGEAWLDLGDFDLRTVETWDTYTIDSNFELAAEGYEVNAWFRDDWCPLSAEEVQRGLDLLAWSRADLWEIAAELPAERLDATYLGQRWSIRGILGHVGGAEWWYLNRLGLACPREEVPEDAFERLTSVRAQLRAALPELIGKAQVVGAAGEFWSPRKLLRRALWHEMDHIGHITQLL
jgi:hypothetical protein